MKNNFCIPMVICLFLVGCISFPVYQPTINDKAKIKIDNFNSPSLCVNHAWYKLIADHAGYASIPSGERIIIANNYNAASSVPVFGGVATELYNCSVALSFVPQIGQVYFTDFELVGTGCKLTIFQKAGKKLTSATIESVVPDGSC